MFKRLKEIPRVFDRIRVGGGVSSTGRGIRNSDGSRVSLAQVQTTFGVDKAVALEILGRRSR